MSTAEEYLTELAETASIPPRSHLYTDVEVPDPVAGLLAIDPRVNIVDVEKGDFGLDYGTMVLDIQIDCGGADDE